MIKTIFYTFFLTIISTIGTAYAGIQIGATRVLYAEGKKEVSVSIHNKDSSPYLIKSWIESTTTSNSYFAVTPPLFRMDGDQKNVVRIFKSNSELPSDKESLFYLNITSIPSMDSSDTRNSLQIAVRTKMKLIYRPKRLMEDIPESFSKDIIWTLNGNTLTAKNPSPYFMNFAQITLNGKTTSMAEKNFIPPLMTTSYELPAGSNKSGTLEWIIINDQGGKGELHKTVL